MQSHQPAAGARSRSPTWYVSPACDMTGRTGSSSRRRHSEPSGGPSIDGPSTMHARMHHPRGETSRQADRQTNRQTKRQTKTDKQTTGKTDGWAYLTTDKRETQGEGTEYAPKVSNEDGICPSNDCQRLAPHARDRQLASLNASLPASLASTHVQRQMPTRGGIGLPPFPP